MEERLCLARSTMLRELTAEHVDRYKTKRLRGVSPVSVNVELRMLKSAFSTAKRWKLQDVNPCDGAAFADVPQKPPVLLSRGEFKELLACINEGWFRNVVLFAVLTGLRRGEVLNLRWDSVDLAKRIVHNETGPPFKRAQGRRRTIPPGDSAFYLLSTRQRLGEWVFTKEGQRINEERMRRPA